MRAIGWTRDMHHLAREPTVFCFVHLEIAYKIIVLAKDALCPEHNVENP